MKKNLFFNISFVVFTCFIARCLLFFNFSDVEIYNEWAVLLNNLSKTGTLGINIVNDNLIVQDFAKTGDNVLPTAFMPPLYVFYIFALEILSLGKIELTKLIIFSQIIISCLSTLIFFKILNSFLSNKTSILLTYLFSLYPANILSSLQTSSITLQLFLFLGFIFYFTNLINLQSYKNSFLLGIFAGLSMLIRGEFWFFFILSNIYLLFILRINLKKILISFLLSLIIISPYLKRNYENFNSIFLVKSFGFNLLKGNNPQAKIEGSFIKNFWTTDKFDGEININYEINRDDFYRSQAIDFIKKDPLKYIKLYFLKLFAFIFIDFNSSYPNYYNLFHIMPKILLSIFTIIGGVLLIKRKGLLQYLALFYFANACFFSIFFILPRYSVMFLPIQIILSFYGYKYLKDKLKIFFN